MASEVNICNLALANLGDTATVTSINPSDGSVQADHCSRFYPVARNALLEMHQWKFATKRAVLAELENDSDQWDFAYAAPSDMLAAFAVIPSEAPEDNVFQVNPDVPVAPMGYTPQPYTIELNSSGAQVVRTNVEDAMLRYTIVVTDTTKFSPLFVVALSWLLSSMLAGPLIKGETGAAESKRCLQIFQAFKAQATTSDASQSSSNIKQVVPWISGR